MKKKRCVFIKSQPKEKSKYPSAEFLYSVSLEDYNRTLNNYDRIYDRINIVLTVCSAVLIVFISNIDVKCILNLQNYSTNIEKISVLLYAALSLASATLMMITVIKLLLLSRSKELLCFDSNCIKDEALYEEKVEDSALWVTLQHIKVVNDIRTKTKDKQKKFNTAIILMIISILCFAFSVLIYNGGLS